MGDVFGQPTASQRTGVEVDEAAVFTGYPCPSGQRCRYADVAVIHIDDSVSVIQLNVARSSKVAEGTNPPYNGYQAYAGSNVQGVLVGDVVT
jgi:hypothetical protein